jgi:hypothetical protein
MTYLPLGPSGPATDDLQTDPFTASVGQKFFSLTKTPLDPADVKMSVNGNLQINGTDFAVSGLSVNFLEIDFTLEAGDKVEFSYHF